MAEEHTIEEGQRRNKNRLSVISKKYDLDGDGQLDAAEQAMRDMDKSGRGFLTQDKVYELMQQHIKTQNQLFSMKRVVIGLACFTAVLAVSNLATAWAAAILAKDTQVQGGALVDKVTGETLGTNPKSNIYNVKEDFEQGDSGRRDLLSIQAIELTKGEVDSIVKGNTAFVRQYCTDGHLDRQINHANAQLVVVGSGGNRRNQYTFPVESIEGGTFYVDCPATGSGNQNCIDEAFNDAVQCPVPDCSQGDDCPAAGSVVAGESCEGSATGCGKTSCGGAYSGCDCGGRWFCIS